MSTNPENRRRVQLGARLALVTLPVVLLLMAFWFGRWHALRPLRMDVRTWFGTTLGSHLDPAGKQAVLPAFGIDGLRAEDLDGFCWVPMISPTPFVGAAPAPGTHASAHVNALQFRDAHELRVPKPSGVYRVFLTGGSTAFGSGASSDATTIGGRLEARLRLGPLAPRLGEIEVFTMATPAWTSTHERIAIENLLADLQPDTVVSLSGNNDVYWSVAGHNVLWGRTGNDLNLFGWIDGMLRSTVGYELRDNLVPYGTMVPPAHVASRLQRNVDLIEHALRPTGAIFVFALQPTLAAVSKRLTAREQAWLARIPTAEQRNFRDCYREIAAGLAPRLGQRFVDLSDSLDELHDRETFLDLFHFGDLGNDRIAAALAARLETVLAAPR